MLVATTNDLAGHRIVRHLGLVRGIVVRSRSIIGNVGASIQSLFGGNITLYTGLCEQARRCLRSHGGACTGTWRERGRRHAL
jgi:uncharacterized protein YbjQ (UPF0145 family)